MNGTAERKPSQARRQQHSETFATQRGDNNNTFWESQILLWESHLTIKPTSPPFNSVGNNKEQKVSLVQTVYNLVQATHSR